MNSQKTFWHSYRPWESLCSQHPKGKDPVIYRALGRMHRNVDWDKLALNKTLLWTYPK